MAKYHINPKTGNVGRCRALQTCPFGDLESDHFSTPEEARTAYERKMTVISQWEEREALASPEEYLLESLKVGDRILLPPPTPPMDGSYYSGWVEDNTLSAEVIGTGKGYVVARYENGHVDQAGETIVDLDEESYWLPASRAATDSRSASELQMGEEVLIEGVRGKVEGVVAKAETVMVTLALPPRPNSLAGKLVFRLPSSQKIVLASNG